MQGLQVFDEFGNLVFDATHRITVVIGSATILPRQTIQATDSAFANGSVFVITKGIDGQDYIDYSLSNNTLTMTWVRGNKPSAGVATSATLIYGVY